VSDRSAKVRLSARRKAEVVVHVMRSEHVDLLCRELHGAAYQTAR